MTVEASLLASQLGQLGRDLDGETHLLSVFEDQAVTLEGRFQRLKETHDDEVARVSLATEGSVETKKNTARLASVESRNKMLDAQDEWNKARSLVRMQMANLNAIRVRIDIGRSLLSNEKSQMALVQSGILWHNANALRAGPFLLLSVLSINISGNSPKMATST